MLTGKTWAIAPTEETVIAEDAKQQIAEKVAEQLAEKRADRDAKNQVIAENLVKIRAEKARQNELNSPKRDWHKELPKNGARNWQSALRLPGEDY